MTNYHRTFHFSKTLVPGGNFHNHATLIQTPFKTMLR